VAELGHAWHLSHAWLALATRGSITTRGCVFPLFWRFEAMRGWKKTENPEKSRPRVASWWLHEFGTRNKRRSHTWVWSAASSLFLVQPRVATSGTWLHGLAPSVRVRVRVRVREHGL